jgi:hypothetical protein
VLELNVLINVLDMSPCCNAACVYNIKTRTSAVHIYHKGNWAQSANDVCSSYAVTSYTQHAAMCEEIGFVSRYVCVCVCVGRGQNKQQIDLFGHDYS